MVEVSVIPNEGLHYPPTPFSFVRAFGRTTATSACIMAQKRQADTRCERALSARLLPLCPTALITAFINVANCAVLHPLSICIC